MTKCRRRFVNKGPVSVRVAFSHDSLRVSLCCMVIKLYLNIIYYFFKYYKNVNHSIIFQKKFKKKQHYTFPGSLLA